MAPAARVRCLPLADGGEGTIEALAAAGGETRRRWVRGPLGEPARAGYLLRGRVAVVEMAQAAGLLLVPPGRGDPVHATTFGVGQLVDSAVTAGARRIVVCIGGSATVDAGAGMAQALGARLLDSSGRQIPAGGAGLLQLDRIDLGVSRRRMRGIRVVGATDVRCPLLGARGARLFTAQKGATKADMKMLDRALARFAAVVRRDLGIDVSRVPGAGAAGGLGAGLVAFLGARLVPGADTIFGILDLDGALRDTDLVVTGEGSLDRQTAHGKLVARVADRARRRRVPVVAFAGRVSLSSRGIRDLGLTGAFGLVGPGVPVRRAMEEASRVLEKRVEEALSEGLL